ncbi:MAG: hypothetical protein PHX88_10380 [Methanoculleus horonobensis]|nr:hypothetical protein [Methanoculleus horonobensis]
MKHLEQRVTRLEQRKEAEHGVVILDRAPEPGEYPPGTVVIVDDIPRRTATYD